MIFKTFGVHNKYVRRSIFDIGLFKFHESVQPTPSYQRTLLLLQQEWQIDSGKERETASDHQISLEILNSLLQVS